MVSVLGLDIGGANTKAAFLNTDTGSVTECKTAMEYFPVWKNPEKLGTVLRGLSEKVSEATKFSCIGVTMTAELSDAYPTKREGVNRILTHVAAAFPAMPILVLTVDATLKSLTEAKAEPLKVAAANWAATGWLVSQLIPDCIVVDVGSTSTSIIPIINGQLSASGKTDLEKLINGELVYTGSLRTNIAAIVQSIPLKGGTARISSELFAQSGDAHLILGNIGERDYTVETADGRGRTRSDALARLARVVCADTETLTEHELVQIAVYIHNKQIAQISEALGQVYARIKPFAEAEIQVVIAGFGKHFLAEKAARAVGFSSIVDLDKLLKSDVSKASPAVGVALLAASKLEGRTIRWTP